MAMLAERRSKQQWSADPRNTFWSKDHSKYGYRMLERMGWSEGRGLGINEDGQADPIKLKTKRDNSGLGAKRGRDDDWITQQDSFEQVLSDLNEIQGSSSCEKDTIKSKELISTARKSKKIIYNKFLRSKDLSIKSDEDMACVLGKKRKVTESPDKSSTPRCCHPTASDEDCMDVKTHGVPTITNSLSVQDYFADKMKKLRERRTTCNTGIKEQEVDQDDSRTLPPLKKNKRKEKMNEGTGTKLEATLEKEDSESLPLVKKSKRKEKVKGKRKRKYK